MIPDVKNRGPRGPREALVSTAMRSDVEKTVAARLDSMGQRFTTGRRALFDVLARAESPLTIGEIVELEPRLPLSTTYRNLTVLQQAGVVRRVLTDHEFARYELAEDMTDHHHHHLVCESCGAAKDVEMPRPLERSVRVQLENLGREAGFKVDSHRLDAFGLCSECARQQQTRRLGT
jgi:Fur family transcriptional regulator, ferric uptake regulator